MIDSSYIQEIQISSCQYVVKVSTKFSIQTKEINLYFENKSISSKFYDLLLYELSKTNNNSYSIFKGEGYCFISNYNDLFQTNTTNYLIESSSYNNFKTFVRILSNCNPDICCEIFASQHFVNKLINQKIFGQIHEERILKRLVVLLLDRTNNTNMNNNCDLEKFKRIVTPYTNEKTEQKIRKKSIKIGYQMTGPYCIENVNKGLTGIDINLVNTIADKLNIKIKYILLTTKGNVFDNGSVTHEYKSLHQKKIDMLIGGYTLTPARMFYFKQTSIFMQERFEWCVPHQHVYPQLIKINKLVVFTIILVYAILVTILWVLDLRNKTSFSHYKNVSDLILSSWAVILGNTTKHLPKFTKIRYVFGLLLIYAYYVNVIITSKLTSSLIKSHPIEKYDSFKKIYDYNLTTYFEPNLIHFYTKNKEIDGVPLEIILSKNITCENRMKCLKTVAEGNSAYFLTKYRKKYLLKLLKENKTAFHSFTFFDPIYTAAVVRNDFPYIKQFNKMINRICASGFITKWIGDIFVIERDEHIVTLEKLCIRHIQEALFIFAAGCSCSLIVFLLEIYLAYKYILMPNVFNY